MVLDAFKEIFVWIGSGANITEQKEALKLAVVSRLSTSKIELGLDSRVFPQQILIKI